MYKEKKTKQSFKQRCQQPTSALDREDDVLLNRPFTQGRVLHLLVRLSLIPLIVPANVLHALIPAVFTTELLSTDPTLAAQGWLALLIPASFTDVVETALEGLALSGGRGARVADPALGCPWGVHATQV